VTPAIEKGARVRGTHPSRAGRLGTVQDAETGRGHELFHVRWDDPGMDDEWVERIFLSADGVPAETLSRQPDPLPERPGLPHVADLVVDRIRARKAAGLREYGVPLQPHNGRDALGDLLDELLDGAHYLTQAIYERDNPRRITDGQMARLRAIGDRQAEFDLRPALAQGVNRVELHRDIRFLLDLVWGALLPHLEPVWGDSVPGEPSVAPRRR